MTNPSILKIIQELNLIYKYGLEKDSDYNDLIESFEKLNTKNPSVFKNIVYKVYGDLFATPNILDEARNKLISLWENNFSHIIKKDI